MEKRFDDFLKSHISNDDPRGGNYWMEAHNYIYQFNWCNWLELVHWNSKNYKDLLKLCWWRVIYKHKNNKNKRSKLESKVKKKKVTRENNLT